MNKTTETVYSEKRSRGWPDGCKHTYNHLLNMFTRHNKLPPSDERSLFNEKLYYIDQISIILSYDMSCRILKGFSCFYISNPIKICQLKS